MALWMAGAPSVVPSPTAPYAVTSRTGPGGAASGLEASAGAASLPPPSREIPPSGGRRCHPSATSPDASAPSRDEQAPTEPSVSSVKQAKRVRARVAFLGMRHLRAAWLQRGYLRSARRQSLQRRALGPADRA